MISVVLLLYPDLGLGLSAVPSLGGRAAPGDTLRGGDTKMTKKFFAALQQILIIFTVTVG